VGGGRLANGSRRGGWFGIEAVGGFERQSRAVRAASGGPGFRGVKN
jgi:hypothetical protein